MHIKIIFSSFALETSKLNRIFKHEDKYKKIRTEEFNKKGCGPSSERHTIFLIRTDNYLHCEIKILTDRVFLVLNNYISWIPT